MGELFQTHLVEKLADVSPFGDWLMDCVRRDVPLAIALRERQRKIALSSRDDAYVIDARQPAGAIALGVLRAQLLEHEQMKLLARQLAHDLADVTRFLAKELGLDERTVFQAVAPAFVGDLTMASRCINQAVTPSSKFRRIDQDAFEIALLEPQFSHGIAPFYTKIGMPIAKMVAEGRLFGNKAAEWWVTYHHLWVKVLTYFTQDPTLTWAFQEGRDPFDVIAAMFKCSPVEAELMLLWAACGMDMETFQTRFATRVKELPPIEEMNEKLRKHLPAMVTNIDLMKHAYWNTRRVETLYGRALRPGHSLGEAVAFRIFGTAEDVVAVASVALYNSRPSYEVNITRYDGGPAETVIRIVGSGPDRPGDKVTWLHLVKQLAALPPGPLNPVALMPQIVEI